MAEFLTTLFVDNLPLSIRKIWVYNLFKKFGKIREVVIPNKKSKVTNQQFGFVRFFSRKAALAAINYTNGSWVWGHILTVQIAKFVNRKKTLVNPPSQPQLQNKKQIWVLKNPTTSHVDYSQEQGNSGVNFLRGAGEAAIHHNFQSIHFQPVGNGWLLRSAVAKIRKLISPKGLEKVFLMENVPVEHVKSIGGRYVIITFPNVETRDETIKDKCMSIWFEEIKPWMGESAKEERFVWLSCFGMPLNGWSIPNFKLIGNLWGDFIQVDEDTLHEKSYEKGRVLIATEQIQKISGNVDFKFLGSSYSVRIEEEASFRIINPDLDPLLSKRVAKDIVNEDPNEKEDKEKDSRTEERELNIELAVHEVNNLVSKNTDLNSLEVMEVVEETPEDMGKCNEKELQVATFKSILLDSRNPQLPLHTMPQLPFMGNTKETTNFIYENMGASPLKSQNSIIDASSTHNNFTQIDIQVESATRGNVEQDSSWSELPFHNDWVCPVKKKVAEKSKKRLKTIDELIGLPKARKGRKKRNKCVLLRSAVAAAALSISSEGIKNRNRIILNEKDAARTVSKILGEDYMGNDDEVMSKMLTDEIEGIDC